MVKKFHYGGTDVPGKKQKWEWRSHYNRVQDTPSKTSERNKIQKDKKNIQDRGLSWNKAE